MFLSLVIMFFVTLGRVDCGRRVRYLDGRLSLTEKTKLPRRERESLPIDRDYTLPTAETERVTTEYARPVDSGNAIQVIGDNNTVVQILMPQVPDILEDETEEESPIIDSEDVEDYPIIIPVVIRNNRAVPQELVSDIDKMLQRQRRLAELERYRNTQMSTPKLDVYQEGIIRQEAAKDLIKMAQLVDKRISLGSGISSPKKDEDNTTNSRISFLRKAGRSNTLDKFPYDSFDLDEIELMIELDLLNIEMQRLIKRLKALIDDPNTPQEVKEKAVKILIKLEKKARQKRERFEKRMQINSILRRNRYY